MAVSESRGAIVLCGGHSLRMERDKATLPCGPAETMLQRVVRLVGQVVPDERIVCAVAPGQVLPELPPAVRIVCDTQIDCGPLAGLAAGLAALEGRSDAAFVVGCDAPLLVPALPERMFEYLGDFDIAAPHDGERFYPLAAAYHVEVLPVVEALLESDERSLHALLTTCLTRRVPTDELRELDPQLSSLAVCNTQEEYAKILSMLPTDEPHA